MFTRKFSFTLFGLLFALTPSYVSTITSTRSDQVLTFGYPGFWGRWRSNRWCPPGSYAKGFSLRTEANQGGGDDTGLNGIALHCETTESSYGWNVYITSTTGPWGTWSVLRACMGDTFVAGARVKMESPQGGGDDTALNNIEFACEDGFAVMGPGSHWGTWQAFQRCPASSAICGLQTRVEDNQGSGDDTALNGVNINCCTKTVAPQIFPYFPVYYPPIEPDPSFWAPTFHFDRAHQCYPTWALNWISGFCNPFFDEATPVYYEAHKCTTGLYHLTYWLFYGWQNGCFSWGDQHDLNWEHVSINFKFAHWTWVVDSVTFAQHGGWYTRHYQYSNERSVPIYIGKVAHGAYHNTCCGGGCDEYCHGGCEYFHDIRNPGIAWKPTNIQHISVAENEGGKVGEKIKNHGGRNQCGKVSCLDFGCANNNWHFVR